MNRFRVPLLVLLVILAESAGSAGTLYRWTDASGTVRYGYQPPPGVEVVPADEEARELRDRVPPISCRGLAEQHLSLIDEELTRVKTLKAGLGPEYDLSPAQKQGLILDLLAHRAALITGREAAEFRSPGAAEVDRLKSAYRQQQSRMEQALQSQEATIDSQKQRLDRQRRELQTTRNLFFWYPPVWFVPPARR